MNSSRLFWSLALATLGLMAITWSADYALTNAISHSESLATGRLARLDDPRKSDEIPIFGASKAEANYVPSVLGPQFYNYGLGSASPDVTNMLLATALRHESKQPVVIDLGHWEFFDVGDPRNYLLLTERPETRIMMRRAGIWKWYYAIPGLRYFGSWDWYVKGLLTDRIALTKRMDRGFIVNLDEAPWSADVFARDVKKRLQTPMQWGLDPRQRRKLMELVGSAPQRQFVLVLSPLHHSCFARASGEKKFRDVLRGMEASASNLRIIDMSRSNYPDRYFLNTTHMNQRGARAFSADLRRELVRLKIIGTG